MFKACIGAGRANEGLRADWQQQLAIVKKECDFKYIRMHGLLTDDMGVYKEDSKGNPQYNFQYIDVYMTISLASVWNPLLSWASCRQLLPVEARQFSGGEEMLLRLKTTAMGRVNP